MENSIISSKKLAYYIVELVAITGFLVKRYHEVIFQSYQIVWNQEFKESNRSTFKIIKGVFNKRP